jgi:hypothetical protein
MPKSSQTKRKYTRKNHRKMSRKYRKKTMWGGKENDKNEIINASDNEIFVTDKISTQPCNDPEYKEIGIIHMSDSIALNILRDVATNFVNLFGKQGFDNTIYDKLRNSCLEKLHNMVKKNQKVYNLRIEIERDEKLICMHLYGTLMESKNAAPVEESVEENNNAVTEPVITEEAETVSTDMTEPVSTEEAETVSTAVTEPVSTEEPAEPNKPV